jgi:hypothetical protein
VWCGVLTGGLAGVVGPFLALVVSHQHATREGGSGVDLSGPWGLFADLSRRATRDSPKHLEAAKKAGVRVALISPNAVDRRVKEGLGSEGNRDPRYAPQGGQHTARNA